MAGSFLHRQCLKVAHFILVLTVCWVNNNSVTPLRAADRREQNKQCSSCQQKQTSNHDEEVGADEVISVRTTEVLLPVTVRDSSGRLVTDLRREDFRVIEDGREQALSDASLRQVPVDVALMVDASSSVAANLDDFERAAADFASQLASQDRISLVKFDDRVELLQDWTASRVQLRRALRRVAPGMFTRFYDALYLVAREQFGSSALGQRRQAVVVLTDGIDSGRGSATAEKSLRELLKSGVAVYVISNLEIERKAKQASLDELLSGTQAEIKFNELRLGDLREGLRVLTASRQNLERLTAATGGRLYNPESFQQLDAVYQEVADELRHQYILYYSPENKTRDGKFRRLQVKLKNPQMNASTRIGYFAPKS